MSKIVFDIETVGQDFELLDDVSKEYFLKYADTEEKVEEARQSLNFYPLTAQIVAIGMLDVETDKGVVFYQDESLLKEKFTEENVTYISGNEEDIIAGFWNTLSHYDQFITFNGRTFDCPFLMVRSAIRKIKAAKNLVPYRYDHKMHVDLADQLSFYDALRRKFSLHMWCKAFGVQSPKQDGMSGLLVKDYFKAGKYKEIARYCFSDLKATKELYLYWDKYIKF